MKKERQISIEVRQLAEKIARYKGEHDNSVPSPANLIPLFSSLQLNTLLSADEAAYILEVAFGRSISLDTVKHLRRTGKLRYAKQLSERAYVYTLQDVIMVQNQPRGRPRKTKYPIT